MTVGMEWRAEPAEMAKHAARHTVESCRILDQILTRGCKEISGASWMSEKWLQLKCFLRL